MNCDFVDKEIGALQENLIRVRRHIHANPEPGANQPETVRFLVEEFKGMDVSLRYGEQCTGLVVDIWNGEGPTIAFRADMDALELQETDDPDHLPNRLGFRSQKEGRMHACGHDAHTTILLGLGHIIHKHKDKIRGRIRLLFQPGEEGFHGAQRMVSEGYLKEVDHVFALHCYPPLKVGQLGYRKGAIFSAIDTFYVTISGIGGHGSTPELASDQVLALCRIVNNAQSIVSRRVSALESAVLSICYVNAGTRAAITVIPEKVEFTGTVRSFTREVQQRVREEFFNVCLGSAKSVHSACNVQIDYQELYPATVNDSETVDRVNTILKGSLDGGHIHDDIKPTLGSEDFSLMLQQAPGVMMFLGVTPRDADPSKAPFLHNPAFDIDEQALSFGVRALARIAFGLQ